MTPQARNTARTHRALYTDTPDQSTHLHSTSGRRDRLPAPARHVAPHRRSVAYVSVSCYVWSSIGSEEVIVIRVLVSGICGRMGGMVAQQIAASSDLRLVGGLEMPTHENVGRHLCELWTGADPDLAVSSRLDEFERGSYDVLVDFSIAAQGLSYCFQ